MTFVFSNQGSLLYSNMQGYASKAVLQLSMVKAQSAASELFMFQMRIVRHDNCHEQVYNVVEDGTEEMKLDITGNEDETSSKLNFTDLKVTAISSDSEYEDIDDDKDVENDDGD